MMGQTTNGKIRKCENQLWEYYWSSTKRSISVKKYIFCVLIITIVFSTLFILGTQTDTLYSKDWSDYKKFKGDEITLNDITIPYRYFIPKNYKENYPLMIYIHGLGQRGTDNKKQISGQATIWTEDIMQKKYPCFVLAPQSHKKNHWVIPDGEHTILHVYKIVDILVEKYKIDRNRIYLTGNSMGGWGTWGAVYYRTNYFAAAIPVAGSLKFVPKNPDYSRFTKTPIWAWNCDKDTTVKPDDSRMVYEKLKDSGLKYTEVKFTKRAGAHGFARLKAFTPNKVFPKEMNTELYDWIFKQRLK